MAQSQNTKVDFSIKATSLNGLTNYGDVMVGDKAFEFYNEKNKEDFIQIPWEEIDYISASVYFNKKIAICQSSFQIYLERRKKRKMH